MLVKVVDYDEKWSEDYDKNALEIKNILKSELINIFHIGSTSVKGLKAKPIIDIMPVVKEIKKVDDYIREFDSIGYEWLGEFGIPNRRFFRKGKHTVTHHIHIFQYDNIYEIQRHLIFRDYLRTHETEMKQYGNLKSKLAKKYPFDIKSYIEGKEEFIKFFESESIKWYLKKLEN